MFDVLIVEDEEPMRKELVHTTPWGDFSCRVVGAASNGIEGEEMIRRLSPHIVITDIRMPGQSGLQMLKNAPCSHTVLLTGYSDFDYAREAIKLGVTDYIVKPVDDDELYSVLKGMTDKMKEEGKKSNLSLFEEYINPPAMDKQEHYVDQAVRYIKSHFQEDISLYELCRTIGITECYMSRLFREKTGYTFLEYLRNHRLTAALELLKDQSLRINEIAQMTGFRDMSYFIAVFRKHIGTTPGRYQNGNR